ncbi:hypothetical protein FSP39_015054 [Pinctada imbricata]|uniref:Uncharacterized protein n=1 Tax=Pinctada imbricata TaxID=66713 RepID=A0AA89C1J7_PINIB|nr:hypothetical protein FSP39_015054 [Pinctada imbricata]
MLLVLTKMQTGALVSHKHRKSIELAVVPSSDDLEDCLSRGHLLLIQYIVAVLDNNFQYHMSRISDGESSVQKLRSSMISQILWPGITQPNMNNKCRQLMSLFWDSLCCSAKQGDKNIIYIQEPQEGTTLT